ALSTDNEQPVQVTVSVLVCRVSAGVVSRHLRVTCTFLSQMMSDVVKSSGALKVFDQLVPLKSTGPTQRMSPKSASATSTRKSVHSSQVPEIVIEITSPAASTEAIGVFNVVVMMSPASLSSRSVSRE